MNQTPREYEWRLRNMPRLVAPLMLATAATAQQRLRAVTQQPVAVAGLLHSEPHSKLTVRRSAKRRVSELPPEVRPAAVGVLQRNKALQEQAEVDRRVSELPPEVRPAGGTPISVAVGQRLVSPLFYEHAAVQAALPELQHLRRRADVAGNVSANGTVPANFTAPSPTLPPVQPPPSPPAPPAPPPNPPSYPPLPPRCVQEAEADGRCLVDLYDLECGHPSHAGQRCLISRVKPAHAQLFGKPSTTGPAARL